jgi:hypothetical protein
MKSYRIGAFLFVTVFWFAAGCANNNGTPPPDNDAKIKTALDKLDPADRKLAEEQKYCALETENRLGSMGKPIKVMIQGQPVFLCCKGCEKMSQKDAEKTLATVERLKSRHE